MVEALNGFYAGYFMGAQGPGLGLFAFKDGVIVEVDAGGVEFDGRYKVSDDGGDCIGEITVKAPPNVTLIQGHVVGPEGLTYTIPIRLPADFAQKPYMRIETPIGPVNVSLKRVRNF